MTASHRDQFGSQATATGRYSIAVIGKALDLLDELDGDDPLTLTELSTRSGIPKPTTLRILANLEGRAYVERDEHGEYRLGMRLLQLGARKSSAIDLRKVARPVMKSLHAEFDETINLAVPGDDGIIYIDILQSARGLRMGATIGMVDDFHSAALGKAIMSTWPADHLNRVIAGLTLKPKTARTKRSWDALLAELEDVRINGFAVDDEENEPGARCVGAPIYDHRGSCIAAISVAGSANRLSAERIASIGQRIRMAASEISANLGYRARVKSL